MSVERDDAGDRFLSLRATARSPSPIAIESYHYQQEHLRSSSGSGRSGAGSRDRFGLRIAGRSPPVHRDRREHRPSAEAAAIATAGSSDVDARDLIQRRRMQRDTRNLRVFVDSLDS